MTLLHAGVPDQAVTICGLRISAHNIWTGPKSFKELTKVRYSPCPTCERELPLYLLEQSNL
jgi:hypothetical protein